MRSRSYILPGVALAIVFALLAVPVLFSGEKGAFCGSEASAQDNPCLSQDATISAMEVVVVQATLDTMNAQGTITALEAQIAAGGGSGSGEAVPPPAPGSGSVLYVESFDNNDRGWPLYTDNNTAARLSQSQLLLSADHNWYGHIPIPQLAGLSAYTITVEVTPRENRGFVGFTMGDFEADFQYLFFGRRTSDSDTVVRLYESIDGDFDQLYSNFYAETLDFWEPDGTPFLLSLELRNNLFTMYLNGEPLEAIPATYGMNAGLAAGSGSGDIAFFFDNVTVQIGP